MVQDWTTMADTEDKERMTVGLSMKIPLSDAQ